MAQPNNVSMETLLSQIAVNGVGFRTLFFRTNMTVESLFNKDNDVNKEFVANEKKVDAFEIRFSDGNALVGTFVITPEMLEEMTTEGSEIAHGTYSLQLVNIEKMLTVENATAISIELFFNSIDGLYGHTAGYALLDTQGTQM
jgi:hypothetical protein